MQDYNESLTKLFDLSAGYVGLILLAIWGGTVKHISNLKKGKVEVFSIAGLLGEWVISGFAGILTAYVCFELNMSWHMTAFFVGIAGHLGAHSITLLEDKVRKHFPGGPF
jgi:hypothetical protein